MELSGYGALGGDGDSEAMRPGRQEQPAAGAGAEPGAPGAPEGSRGWRRLLRRARGAAAPGDDVRVLWRVAGWALGYPDEAFRARIRTARELVGGLPESRGAAAAALRSFLDHAEAADAYRLAADYVAVFDRRNRHSLHLTWWTDGDTRRRGSSLVRFKRVYREHGLLPADEGELPDFLPLVLEFAAARPEPGARLLAEHRRGLEELSAALHRARTPYAAALYAAVLDALLGTVPTAPGPGASARPARPSGPPPRLLPVPQVPGRPGAPAAAANPAALGGPTP
jgi:nitrate reductase delta subunit